MSNLYTSELIVYSGSNTIEKTYSEINIDVQTDKLQVLKYTANDVLIGELTTPAIVEDTKVTVYLTEGQVQLGEKIKLVIDRS